MSLAVLGLYSNYYLVVSAIAQILKQVFNAFTSSVGNLIVKEKIDKAKEVFDQLYYFTILVYCVVCICLYLLFNDFVFIWLGDKYLLSNFAVFTIVGHLYINGVQFAGFTFRNASGNFRQFRYLPVLAAGLNVFLSIVLAKRLGLGGVFLATMISRFCTSTWVDPYIVYKNIFKSSVREYFIKYIKYFVIVLICFIPCYFVSKLILVTNIWSFVIKGVTLVLISLTIFLLFTCRTKEFVSLKRRIMYFINSRILKRS